MGRFKYFLIFLIFVPFSSMAFVSGNDRFELSFGTEFPVQIALQGRYHFSSQIYTELGAGFAMDFFIDTYRRVGPQLGMEASELHLVTRALTNSVIFDGSFGWGINMYQGPYLEAGYRLMVPSDGRVERDIILSADIGRQTLPEDETYTINIFNHGPTFHIGYRFILIDKLSLNLELGVYKPLFSVVRIDYGESVTATKNESEKISDILFYQTWFLSVGLWLNLSF